VPAADPDITAVPVFVAPFGADTITTTSAQVPVRGPVRARADSAAAGPVDSAADAAVDLEAAAAAAAVAAEDELFMGPASPGRRSVF